MADSRLGFVHVYTGEGKGKTTASLGLALRALGQGLSVYMVQFMKGGSYTGEILAAKNLIPQFKLIQFGKGCIKQDKQLNLAEFGKCPKGYFVRDEEICGDCRDCFLKDDEQKSYVRGAFEHANRILQSGKYDLVILDEINYAVDADILSVSEVLKLIEEKNKETELVLTGRHAKKEIIERADLVSNVTLVKHYFDKGVQARRGIEY